MTLAEINTSGIYLHINPSNRRIFYVGYTSAIDGRRPYTGKRNAHWKNTVNKYGKEVVLFAKGGRIKMLELERKLISVIGLDSLTNISPGGEEPWNKGIPCTEASKLAVSKANKGIKRSEEWRKHLSEITIGRKLPGQVRPDRFKEVSQYSKQGKFIKTFEAIQFATDITKISRTAIMNNLHNRSKSAGGFTWVYTNFKI